MLERDGAYPTVSELCGELAAIRSAIGRAPAHTDAIHPGLHVRSGLPVGLPRAVPDVDRHALADAQDRLLMALLGLAESPPGFDAERMAVARAALARKRSHATAKQSSPISLALRNCLGALKPTITRRPRR
jgi:hypothetical protein